MKSMVFGIRIDTKTRQNLERVAAYYQRTNGDMVRFLIQRAARRLPPLQKEHSGSAKEKSIGEIQMRP